tara:strand:- start:71 stop:1063 length:993 start_codon:yes stop_codon:yes gene_type:complete
MTLNTPNEQKQREKMKPDSTSATLNLSSKIRMLFSLILGIFFIGSSPIQNQSPQVIPELLISSDTLKNLPSKEMVIVDTRSKFKFLIGHIPGAVNLNNWKDFTTKKDGVEGLLIRDRNLISHILGNAGLRPTQSVIIYGDPKNPWRTDGRFFWMFERYGFAKVAILDGGLDSWKESGGTVERGFPVEHKTTELDPKQINLKPETFADKLLIKKVLNNKNYILIDNRTQREYLGATPYGSPRGGHIPNAINIYWPAFFNKNGTLKSALELSKLLNESGIESHQEIIVYCTGGVRSAMAYFVFRYLGYKVRNYDGSWWDWSSDTNLPVEIRG